MSYRRFTFNSQTALLASVLLLNGISTGCSVYMAAKQPGKKDLSVLNAGTPRPLVLAELGTPIATEKKDGRSVDTFAFTQGYSGGVKASRAAFHAAADVFTIGMWEVVATPAEVIFNGTDVKIQVEYNAQDQVEHVQAFSGANEVRAASGVPLDQSRSVATPPSAPASPPTETASSTTASERLPR